MFESSGVSLPPELAFTFQDTREEEGIIAACKGMDFLLITAGFPLITRRILENIPSVQMIQSVGIGYDKVDIACAEEVGIPVANSPGETNTTVAEFTIATIIALQRNILLADREIKAGNFGEIRTRLYQSGQKEICDIRLGLVGLGAIGRKVAQIAGLLGAEVVYYDPYRLDPETEKKLSVVFKPLSELLHNSDVVSLHLPLNEQTRNLIGRKELGHMKAGALLINTARGEIIDQEALAEALESRHLAGAAIDTVHPEPPPQSHPLLNLSDEARDRLLITPHIAGTTRSAFRRMLTSSLSNIALAARGEEPGNVVNNIWNARKPNGVHKKSPK
jgi:phosphoglycerate dehydrogenase-like enzyme